MSLILRKRGGGIMHKYVLFSITGGNKTKACPRFFARKGDSLTAVCQCLSCKRG